MAPSLIMEEVDSANILGEPHMNCVDDDEEEEVYYASVPASKLQPRLGLYLKSVYMCVWKCYSIL